MTKKSRRHSSARRQAQEDAQDARDLRAAIKENAGRPTVSHQTMMARYGLADEPRR